MVRRGLAAGGTRLDVFDRERLRGETRLAATVFTVAVGAVVNQMPGRVGCGFWTYASGIVRGLDTQLLHHGCERDAAHLGQLSQRLHSRRM